MPASWKPIVFNPRKPRSSRLAEMASKATDKSSTNYTKLVKENCWNAAIVCAEMAGAIGQRAARALRLGTTRNNYTTFLPPGSTRISNQAQWDNIPAGQFVGLVGDDVVNPGQNILAHAMVSLGNGWMAGTNNGPIGLDGDWTSFQLNASHSWNNGFLVYSNRNFEVYARDIESEDKAVCVIQ